MNYNNLCINCMREKPDHSRICPYCNYDAGSYTYPPYVLPPMTPLSGKYIIGRMLGAGGFGITYLALDTVLDRVVAIKEFFLRQSMYRHTTMATEVTISMSSYGQQKVYEVNRVKFEQEAKTLAKLTNLPGVVRVYDFFKENNTLYMVLEYLPGMTLKEYVASRGGRMSFDEVIRKLTSVMTSLNLLHNATLVSTSEMKTPLPMQKSGIIHRDISPDNIMVSPEGELTLFDFGGAKIQGDDHSSVVLAKCGYTPIEQLQSGEEPGPWMDVYALAATIYYCLCGNAPAEAAMRVSSVDTLVKPSALGVRITPEQEAVLLKGLAVHYKDRYKTMAEFQNALLASLKSGPGPVPLKPSRLLLFAVPAAIAVIVLGIFAVKSLTGKKGSEPEQQEVVLLETTEAETKARETEAPETEAPETEAPETEAPETEAPETEAPETELPEQAMADETTVEEIVENYNMGRLSYGEAAAQMEDCASHEEGMAQLERLKNSKDAYEKGNEFAGSSPAEALNWYGQVIEEDVNYTETQERIAKICTEQVLACQSDVNAMLAENQYGQAINRIDSAMAVVPDNGELAALREQCVAQYSSYALSRADELTGAQDYEGAKSVLNEAYSVTGDAALQQKMNEIDQMPKPSPTAMMVINADGSMTYNGHLYMLYDMNDYGIDSYYEMEAFCEGLGGHLAVISSEPENSAIYQYVLNQGLTMAFFGYSDEEQEGVWQWVNDEENPYTNWADGQPNNGANNKKKKAEDYAHFAADGNGTWNDAPFGSNTAHFVCEWEWEI